MADVSRSDNPFDLPVSNVKQSTDLETDGNYLIGKSFYVFLLKSRKLSFSIKWLLKFL